jgi:hypothetical protein
MDPLKADELAQMIQQALPKAWKDTKNSDFPGRTDDPDQLVLFRAIARGLLHYLKVHQNELMTTITLDSIGARTVTALTLNIPQELP